jgi:hypothetical protein
VDGHGHTIHNRSPFTVHGRRFDSPRWTVNGRRLTVNDVEPELQFRRDPPPQISALGPVPAH